MQTTGHRGHPARRLSRRLAARGSAGGHRRGARVAGANGYDPVYGARPLRRLVQTAIGDRLAQGLLGGEIRDGDTVVVDRPAGGRVASPAADRAGVPSWPEVGRDATRTGGGAGRRRRCRTMIADTEREESRDDGRTGPGPYGTPQGRAAPRRAVATRRAWGAPQGQPRTASPRRAASVRPAPAGSASVRPARTGPVAVRSAAVRSAPVRPAAVRAAALPGVRRGAAGADRLRRAHAGGAPLTVRAGIGAFVGSIVLSLVATVITLLNLDTLSRLAATGPVATFPRGSGAVRRHGRHLRHVGLVVGLVFTGVFALFVWFAWRGHNWARIVLWVLAGLGIVFGTIGPGSARRSGRDRSRSSPSWPGSRCSSTPSPSCCWPSRRPTSGTATAAGCAPRGQPG